MDYPQKENLEKRLERIRMKNEEIEKKHREAEEDRLMALKHNAMVTIKSPRSEDWPEEHKYDKIDFTFDVGEERQENAVTGPAAESWRRKKEYTKFVDIPPDPSYKFLADKDRDGDVDGKFGGNVTAANGQTKKRPENQGSFKKHGSFRNNNNRNRDSGNKKTTDQPTPITQTSPKHHQQVKNSDKNDKTLTEEQRGNIRISVSNDGEIKSVQLTSRRTSTPGSGRVGFPRAITKQQHTFVDYPAANNSNVHPRDNPTSNFGNTKVLPPPSKSIEVAKKSSVQNRLNRPHQMPVSVAAGPVPLK